MASWPPPVLTPLPPAPGHMAPSCANTPPRCTPAVKNAACRDTAAGIGPCSVACCASPLCPPKEGATETAQKLLFQAEVRGRRVCAQVMFVITDALCPSLAAWAPCGSTGLGLRDSPVRFGGPGRVLAGPVGSGRALTLLSFCLSSVSPGRAIPSQMD